MNLPPIYWFRFCLLLSFALCSNSSLAQTGYSTQLDWVLRKDLTPEQAEKCPKACAGAYIASEREDEDADLDPREATIRGEADTGEIRTDVSSALLQGNVRFTQGYRELQAEKVEIDREAGYLHLEENVLIREPGILLQGESAEIIAENDQITIDGGRYLFHEQRIRGSAERIERSPAQGISVDNATYTACEPGDEAWTLIADNIHINEDTGVAIARGVKMETGGIPFFYAPYFQFIIDDRRASGLLYPDIGYSTDEGFTYDQPYYFNIAENQDLTLTPRITTERGIGLEAEYRILTNESYNQLAAVFFPNDDINLNHPDERWATNIQHKGSFDLLSGTALKSQIDIQAVSDDDFLNDWGTNVFAHDRRDVYLKQDAQISTQISGWEFSASTTGYQNLIDRDQKAYRELPRISADKQFLLGEIAFDLQNEWSSFEHENNLVTTGKRLRANWSASWNKESPWGYIKPKLGVQYLKYNLENQFSDLVDETPSMTTKEFSLDTGLFFERSTSLFGSSSLQTLEPRAYYLYRDAGDQSDMPLFDTGYASPGLEQLFSDSEFIGGDRIEDANRLSIGVWSRFFSQEGQREILSLGIGQTFYISDRSTQLFYSEPIYSSSLYPSSLTSSFITLDSITSGVLSSTDTELAVLERNAELSRNRSDTIIEAQWHISREWSVLGDLHWDDSTNEIDQSRLALEYRPLSSESFFKLSYQQQEDFPAFAASDYFFELSEIKQDIKQLTLSGKWQIGEQWNLAFLLQDDMENKRDLDRILGVTYESCCWNISVSWRDELVRSFDDGFIVSNPTRDKSIVINFEFFGLGGLGKSSTELMSER